MPTNFNQYQIPQTITMFTVHGEEGDRFTINATGGNAGFGGYGVA